ncbi:MAG: hypothetical protein IPI11_00955 [Haliscomenobacter sp.]|nr:hypothetical protein [Haliscomenobacter sp.]
MTKIIDSFDEAFDFRDGTIRIPNLKQKDMFLINWLQANLLMVFTTLVLIGIPAVMIYVAFKKYKGVDANKEEFEKTHPKE